MKVGIDAVEFEPGNLQLDLEEVFAPGVDEPPEKFSKGLGLTDISLPDVYEDIVTLGANAARRLMEREGLKPRDIGRIDVATESSFDRSKPASTYIAGCLEQVFEGDFRHADKGERKFACISGTQVLNDALNWVQSGMSNGKKALVIASDLAFYERGGNGEATQGAGAVAMLVDRDPSLVSVTRVHGFGSKDETDFLKPNQQYPSVDGKRSMRVYLDRMREALQSFEAQKGVISPDEYALAPFHTPFPGMVRKAAAVGFRRVVRETDMERDLVDEIGMSPRQYSYDTDEAYDEAMDEWMADLRDSDVYSNWYDRAVAPTLEISSSVGNWYTGSVHVARLSGLWVARQDDRELTDKKLLVASYGSGAQAEVHEEVVQDGWQEKVDRLDIHDRIAERTSIPDFETYREIHAAHEHDTDAEAEALTTPSNEFVKRGHGDMGERVYEFVA